MMTKITVLINFKQVEENTEGIISNNMNGFVIPPVRQIKIPN